MNPPKGILTDLISLAGPSQIRLAHTDIQTPDFSDYRRDQVKRANAKNSSADERAAFTYLMVGGWSHLSIGKPQTNAKTLSLPSF